MVEMKLMPKVYEITNEVRDRFATKPLDITLAAHAYTEWIKAGEPGRFSESIDMDFGISNGWLWVKTLD